MLILMSDLKITSQFIIIISVYWWMTNAAIQYNTVGNCIIRKPFISIGV